MPPNALFIISFVLIAVSPTYLPTKSALVTSTTLFESNISSPLNISPKSLATVVFPVPGLPVNTICNDIGIGVKPNSIFFLFVIV